MNMEESADLYKSDSTKNSAKVNIPQNTGLPPGGGLPPQGFIQWSWLSQLTSRTKENAPAKGAGKGDASSKG